MKFPTHPGLQISLPGASEGKNRRFNQGLRRCSFCFYRVLDGFGTLFLGGLSGSLWCFPGKPMHACDAGRGPDGRKSAGAFLVVYRDVVLLTPCFGSGHFLGNPWPK